MIKKKRYRKKPKSFINTHTNTVAIHSTVNIIIVKLLAMCLYIILNTG